MKNKNHAVPAKKTCHLGKGGVIAVAIFSLIMLSSSNLTFFIYPHRMHAYIIEILSICLSLIFLLSRRKIFVYEKDIIIILCVTATSFLIIGMYHGEISCLKTAIFLIILVFIVYPFLSTFIQYESLCNILVLFITLMSILGTIAFFLILLFNIKPFLIHSLSNGKVIYDYLITRSVGSQSFGNLTFIRYSGFFHEPGGMGFYIIFAFILNKLVLKSKIYEFLLLVGGLLTFSLAFYITITFYYLSYFVTNRKFIKLALAFIIILSLGIYINSSRNNNIISNTVYFYTLNRLSPSEKGENILFRGDNRSQILRRGWYAFKEKPLFGWGHDYVLKSFDQDPFTAPVGGTVITDSLVISGIFGFLSIFLLFIFCIYWGFRNKYIDSKIYLVMLIIQSIQRSDQLSFLTIIFMICFYISFKRLAH